MLKPFYKVISIMLLSLCSACTQLPPIKPVASVDLRKFMGDWYVIHTMLWSAMI
jgi:apolipoprotein D and lipocalin family protein